MKTQPLPGRPQTELDALYVKAIDLLSQTDSTKGAAGVGWRPPSGTGDGRTLAAMLLGQYADPKDYGAYGGEKVTTGTVTSGDLSHITLTSVTGLTKGMDLMIETLGTSGGKHYSNISSIAGSVVTLATPVVSAGTGVTVTVYDRPAMMRAIAYLNSVGGGILRLDATHVIGQAPVQMSSNIRVIGTPRGILKHHANTAILSLADVTNLVGQGGTEVKNVSFEGVTFDGNLSGQSSWTAGVQEFMMCARSFDGENVTFKNCLFKDPIGDGILLTQPASNPLGCKRTLIDGNRFIGTNANRNGVSVTSGTETIITNNFFYRMGRSSMPGAIDVEPDANKTVKDVLIANNTIDNTGGSATVAGIQITASASGSVVERVRAISNTIKATNVTYGFQIAQGSTGSTKDIYLAYNSVRDATHGVKTWGNVRPEISHNHFEACSSTGIDITDTSAPKVLFNTFRLCPFHGINLDLGTVGACRIIGNHFIDCGLSTNAFSSCIIVQNGGNEILNNRMEASTTSFMLYGIFLSGTAGEKNVIDGNNISNAGTFQIRINTTATQIIGDKNVLGTNVGVSNSMVVPPTAGTWPAGQRIYMLTPAAGAAPGYVCTTGGSPGTWKAMASLAA
jgi:hypothetical protein